MVLKWHGTSRLAAFKPTKKVKTTLAPASRPKTNAAVAGADKKPGGGGGRKRVIVYKNDADAAVKAPKASKAAPEEASKVAGGGGQVSKTAANVGEASKAAPTARITLNPLDGVAAAAAVAAVDQAPARRSSVQERPPTLMRNLSELHRPTASAAASASAGGQRRNRHSWASGPPTSASTPH